MFIHVLFLCVLWCGKIYDLTKLTVFPTLQPKPVENQNKEKKNPNKKQQQQNSINL